MPSRIRSPLAVIVALAVGGCAAAPRAERFESATVTATAGELLPGDAVRVRRFGTVVFRNARADAPMDVTVLRPLWPSQPCSTMLGFTADGETSVARGIAAPAFASLCFHDAGSFPFVVRVAGRELRGTVEVSAEAR
ncbi:MAG TPA: hypothetical protein VF384_18435 [Planctomycetota bacterium]